MDRFLPWLILTLGCVAYSQEPIPSGDRERAVSNKKVDLGVVAPNSIIKFNLLLPNTSTKACKIRKVDIGCSCTEVRSNIDRIAAKETAIVDLIFKSGGTPGEQVTTVAFELDSEDDSDHSLVRFHIRALIRPDCRWSHSNGSILKIGDKPVEIKAVNYGRSDWSNLSLRINGERSDVIVKLSEDKVDQKLRQIATIEIDESTLRLFELPCDLKLELREDHENYSFVTGELLVFVERLQPLQVVPRTLTATNGEVKALLLVSDGFGQFDNESIDIEYGTILIQASEIRKVSPRWIQVLLDGGRLPGDLKEVTFTAQINGKKVSAKANVERIPKE